MKRINLYLSRTYANVLHGQTADRLFTELSLINHKLMRCLCKTWDHAALNRLIRRLRSTFLGKLLQRPDNYTLYTHMRFTYHPYRHLALLLSSVPASVKATLKKKCCFLCSGRVTIKGPTWNFFSSFFSFF